MVEIFLAAKVWDSETIGKFYKALESLPDEEKCDCTVFLAQTLSKRGGKENSAAAAELLRHAIDSYADITIETKARMHWALGHVLEYDFNSYKEAFEQYTAWKDLSSSISGAYIALTRCLLLRDNFVYSEELEEYLKKSYGDGDAGYREDRLYECIARYVIYAKQGDAKKKTEYRGYAQAIIKSDENFLPDFLFKPDAIKDKLNVPQKVRIYVKEMT